MIQRYLVGVLVFGIALWAMYLYVDNRGYERCQKEEQAARTKLITDYTKRIIKAEGERDANKTIVDRLALESRSLHIHICPDTADTKNTDGETRLLSKRVDESFADLQTRGTVLFERCEALNLDAIRVNEIVQ